MTSAESLITAVSHPAVPTESGREPDMRAQSSFRDGTLCHYAARLVCEHTGNQLWFSLTDFSTTLAYSPGHLLKKRSPECYAPRTGTQLKPPRHTAQASGA